MSGALALARVELRRLRPLAGVPLVALALPAFAWLVQGDWRFAHDWFPDLVVAALIPLAAAGIGAESTAGEREEGAAAFVRARPLSRRAALLTKAGASLGVLAFVALGCGAVVHAFRGASVGWLERLDVSGAQGAALAVLAGLSAFACAFAAGLKLDDPVPATIVGVVGAAAIVALLLSPGLAVDGTLRTALSGPREWRAIARASAEPLAGDAAWTSPRGGFRVVQARDRVVLVLLDEGSRRVVLPAGSTASGRFDGEAALVSLRAGCGRVERLVGADGRTRRVAETSP